VRIIRPGDLKGFGEEPVAAETPHRPLSLGARNHRCSRRNRRASAVVAGIRCGVAPLQPQPPFHLLAHLHGVENQSTQAADQRRVESKTPGEGPGDLPEERRTRTGRRKAPRAREGDGRPASARPWAAAGACIASGRAG
jgi:hypothetical protein